MDFSLELSRFDSLSPYVCQFSEQVMYLQTSLALPPSTMKSQSPASNAVKVFYIICELAIRCRPGCARVECM